MAYGVSVNFAGVEKASTGVSERIEPGIYDVRVKDIDRVALKGGAAGYGAKFKFEILNEGPMKGREVGDLLNVESTSPEAARIAKERFAGMAAMSGVPESAVLNQQVPIDNMIGRALSIVLGPQKDAPQYVEVKAFMPSGATQNPENWQKMEHFFKAPAAPAGNAQTMQGGWGAGQQQAPQGGGWGAQAPAQQQPAGGAPTGPAAATTAAPQQSTWGPGPS
jgi:hypothetical protein